MAKNIEFDILARDRASRTFDKVAKSSDGLGSKVAGIAKAAAAAAAVTGAVVGKMAFDAIGKASDLNETLNKSNVIFGKNAGAMEKWAAGAANSLGLSKSKALEAAAGFGDMFSQLGFAGGKASAMSKAVVQMSADLGSFNNLPTEDVANRLSAAFRGEFDSLQALIPNINAARVETQALAMTGKKAADDLTAQEKAAATLAIVQKDSARATGDFAKTSDGLANKKKILTARIEDLQAKIGEKLAPVMETILELGEKAISWAEKQGPAFQKVGDKIEDLIAAAKKFITEFKNGEGAAGKLKSGLQTAGDVVVKVTGFLQRNAKTVREVAIALGAALVVFKTITTAVKVYTAVQAALNVVLALNPIGIVILAIAALTAGIVYAYRNSETFRRIVGNAFNVIKIGAIQLALVAVGAFRNMVSMYLTVVSTLVNGAAKAFGWVPGLGPKLKGAADKIAGFKDSANASLGRIEKSLTVQLNTAQAKKKADDLAAYYRSRNWTVTATANVRMVYAGNGRLVPAKARGGPVNANEPTLVGEEGPELVTFPSRGMVTPADETARILRGAGRVGGSSGGGTNVYVTVQGSVVGGTPDAIAQYLHRLLLDRKRGNGGVNLGLA